MSTPVAAPVRSFSSYQKFVVALLAFLQFTIILDFMILSPLGAVLMPSLHISPAQFGSVVSAYAFSAGISSLLAAGFADRFDRKKLLLFFYTGFVLGTLMCGLAPNYHMLLIARVVTGLFGGVIGSIVLAITTDLFELDMRGRVMGYVQTAFAASQILGIPAGLFVSNHWGWHAPFLMIVAISAAVGVLIWLFLKPINAHLALHPDRNPFHHLLMTVSVPRYLLAFAATSLLSIGGFMLMPFGSAFTVHNLGIDMDKLPTIYLITGVCAIFMGPLVGRASDSFGKFKVFTFGTAMSILMVVVYTNLGVTPLSWVIVVNALMFVGIFSRMIPSQALTSAIPEPASRGAFMAVSASLQQVSGGLASLLAGWIVIEGADGKLEHFNTLGYIMVGTALISLVMMAFIHRLVPEK
ncbi:MAG: MFS transporter [Bdellovibrionaceae bacterium]|nr:MFS transporter [Pseudobdellovibrionaceae bacterium]MBX3033923.1 MFS transporter [Pseudobdellovibrionaceae bacterium]